METKYLTTREAAQYLRVNVYSIRKWKREGILNPAVIPGGSNRKRYTTEELDACLLKPKRKPKHE